MRGVGAALALAVAVAACASGGDATAPRPTPPSTAAPTTTVVSRPEPSIGPPVTCGDAPPAAFAILCQAYELIERTYVQPIDPPALAAAALAGVTEVQPATGAPNPNRLVCALPDAAFDTVCAEITARARLEDVPVTVLVEGAVEGMFRFGLDPFSIYIPPGATDSFAADTPGLVTSLGIVVGTRTPDGQACSVIGEECRLEVVTVVDFGPAAAAGLTVGDIIEEIDGVPVAGTTLVTGVAHLQGPAGSSVTVEIRRGDRLLSKTMVRTYVPTAYVEWDLVARDTAWIHLADFSQTAAQALGEVLGSDDLDGVDRIVLDLRGNPGGLLAAAQAVVSQFGSEPVAFVLHGADGTVEIPTLPGGLATDVRLAILVDRGTASAAEVVAAALQESGRATVVGERTFGKDLVQDVFRLRNGAEVHISTAHWTTPEGASVRIGGVVPDIEVPADPGGVDDPVLETALAHLGR